MPVTTRFSKFTAAEKVAIKALVQLNKQPQQQQQQQQPQQQRPRRACTIKEEPKPRSAMDRPRRSGVRY